MYGTIDQTLGYKVSSLHGQLNFEICGLMRNRVMRGYIFMSRPTARVWHFWKIEDRYLVPIEYTCNTYFVMHPCNVFRSFRSKFVYNTSIKGKQLLKCKKKYKKDGVQLYWPGYHQSAIHERYPTTAGHGNFCLLCHHPGPIRSSLDNQELPQGAHIDAELSADARST